MILLINMKKFIISTLCYLILFNSFIATFSDSVYAKESFFEGVKKQYLVRKENAKKAWEEWRNSGVFKDKRVVGVMVGVATLGVIYVGKCMFGLFNRANSLKTEEIPVADDDIVRDTTVERPVNVFSGFAKTNKNDFEEEEAEYGD